MKKTTRILALTLVFVMALGLLPVTGHAAEGDFVIENGVLKKYNGSGGDVVIPSRVTQIGDMAFLGCKSVTGVTIPGNVTSIGMLAFSDCTGLTKVTIGNGVTSIARGAFLGCTSLTSVTIPAGVSSLGVGVFADCTSLTAIRAHKDNRICTSVDGVLFAKDMRTLAAYPGGKKGTYAIPKGVAKIWKFAFQGCTGLTGVTIPSSVTSIQEEAFYGCTGLTSVTIPSSVTSIQEEAFYGCTGLTSVTLPSSVADISKGAFRGCTGLTGVVIPTSVTSISREAFTNCAKLSHVYYAGTKTQWEKIEIDPYAGLTEATIHYNAIGSTITAKATNDKLTVGGVSKAPTAYKINNANYFQLRDVAVLLSGTKAQFSVEYDNAAKAIKITTGQPYQPNGKEMKGAKATAEAIVGNNDVYINGVKVDFAVYKIGGSNFFQIRDLGKALGFNVDWAKDVGIIIDPSKPYSGK